MMRALGGLDPSHLVALHALLEERQVTRAAQRLGVTQSSMSHRLRKLREALGDPLLVRSGATLIPTPRAQAIAAPLADALDALARAVRIPAPFEPASAQLSVTLGMPDLLVTLLPAVLEALQVEAPGVTLQVAGVPVDLAEQLAAGEPSLVIAPTHFAGDWCRARKLGALRFGVAARRGHPATRGRLTLKKWLAHGHIVIDRGGATPNLISRALAAQDRERRVAVRVDSFLNGLLLAARTDLLMNAPGPLVDEVADTLGLEVRKLPITLPQIPFALLWHERWHADPAHRWVRERVFDVIRERLARR